MGRQEKQEVMSEGPMKRQHRAEGAEGGVEGRGRKDNAISKHNLLCARVCVCVCVCMSMRVCAHVCVFVSMCVCLIVNVTVCDNKVTQKKMVNKMTHHVNMSHHCFK